MANTAMVGGGEANEGVGDDEGSRVENTGGIEEPGVDNTDAERGRASPGRAEAKSTPEEGGQGKKRKRGNREGIELGLPSADEMMGGRRMRRVASGLLDTGAVHRRSIDALAKLVVAGRRTIVITGAGLSCASGIPPFRSKSGDKDAVWARHMEQIGTRAGFLADPCGWYNDFWLPNFSPSQLQDKSPNSGHEAIASLAMCAPHLRVVTQNIDALHQSTTVAWPAGGLKPPWLLPHPLLIGILNLVPTVLWLCISDLSREMRAWLQSD